MEPERHLEILRAESDLLAAYPADALEAVVPSVPEWTGENVIRHVGKIHQWVTGALGLKPGEGMGDIGPLAGMPKGADCLPAYRESVDTMIAAFEQRDPDEDCLNFAGVGTVGWWLRRQAQEVSVHRVDAYDAVHAAGGPESVAIPADAAADGIDEWARFFVAVRMPQRLGPPPADLIGHTVHIHGTDDPAPADGAEWLMSFTAEAVAVEATHAKGDVALRGPANDLLLVLWRRRPLGSIDVIGDASVAERLLDVTRI